jgi:hypothetical protein
MGEKDGGGLGGFLQKANQWLKDQGVTHEDLEKAKAQQEQWEAEATEQRDEAAHADREAKAGDSKVTLTGVVSGTVDHGMAVTTDNQDGVLFVNVDTVDPVPLTGGGFLGFSFSIPGYHGAGTYDLAKLDTSGQTFELMLDNAEEGFYWAAEYGPGIVTVAAGEATADVQFTYNDPGSHEVKLQGTVHLH